MLGKLLTPFTTATATGVNTRYLTIAISAVLSLIELLKWLSPEQIAELRDGTPTIVTALVAAAGAAIWIYGVITKSSSDRSAEVAKQIDATLPPGKSAEVKTPAGIPDIHVPAVK